MKRYRDLSGDSGVSAYEIEAGAIIVRFRSGATYRYTAASAGKKKIAMMQRLAASGRRLSSFISRHVKDGYEARLR